MKLIIAGSRGITDYDIVYGALIKSEYLGYDITEIVSGTANGVDKLGEQIANNLGIKLTKFPADWSKGRSAGFQRNTQMANYSDLLLAVTNGSNGTKHMIKTMQSQGKEVYIENIT